MHGLLGSSQNWSPVAARLKHNFNVYLPDLRNHGDSPHDDTFGYDEMAEDVKLFMQRHLSIPAAVLGHSMGGKVAMRLAALYPQLLNSLIIVDIAPKSYVPDNRAMLSALLSLELERYGRLEEIFSDLEAVIPDTATRYFLLKNIVRSKSGRYRWRINLSAIHDNYPRICADPGAKDVTMVRALFVRGEQSGFIKDEDIGAIRALFPQSSVSTIADAGHWVHIDSPKATCMLIGRFLEPSYMTASIGSVTD